MEFLKNGGVIWITGLAGSGKSYIAEALCKKLKEKYNNIIYLDGDELRDLLGYYGYDKQSRIKMSIKRSKFAHFLSSQNMLVIVSTISMWNEIYEYNKKTLKNYFEIYIKCDFEELKRRDKKNLYSKTLKGEISNVVGIDIAFDEPKSNLIIDNTHMIELDNKISYILTALKIPKN
ncbi:TPA: adenylyl-sulfate kinase [Campylobacter jejuni]|nr:adenylyl-sulfate kinase [Campylobacter jejuni]HDZ5084194.1 adenylyl-sulfate kinase [Campylobacter jejuni]HDZ5086048.1 adenylyl-sulfate kinase [Campylobacter jejuni]HDZ5087474.1 adenylyl-sulfate kinase [Campylobacter jejuni]HDZ5090956.1 adenylyl-sulfate kinase [Campylobacter jejuni]